MDAYKKKTIVFDDLQRSYQILKNVEYKTAEKKIMLTNVNKTKVR